LDSGTDLVGRNWPNLVPEESKSLVGVVLVGKAGYRSGCIEFNSGAGSSVLVKRFSQVQSNCKWHLTVPFP
jgi:hypothetical protein